ncbi:MAG: EI24 domain-containing protein [Flavobacteriales bacterium]|nr:EI24 domain-containing protein [Flavobacteriales bacterium]
MRIFFSDLGLGLRTWLNAWSFIFSNGLAHYFIYPLVISILLAMGAMTGIDWLVDRTMDIIAPHLEYQPLSDTSWWAQLKMFFASLSEGAIKFLLWIFALFLYWKLGKYLVLMVMSPIMALLSERTDKILTGENYPFDGPQFVRDVLRGVLLALRNIFMELFSIIALWMIETVIIFVMPPLALLLAPVFLILSFAIGAYFFGFSTIDYTNERQRLKIGESVKSIRSMKGVAVGNGAMFSLFFMIPFVGTTIATVTCTVAATLALHERRDSMNNMKS